MQGFCGKCGGTFEGQMLCPQCGVRLRGDTDATATISLPDPAALDAADGPSDLRRLAVGALTVAGLFFALLHLGHAVTPKGAGDVTGGTGYVMAAAVFVAAVLAGVANRRAEWLGLFFGLGGGVAVVAQSYSIDEVIELAWLASGPAAIVVAGLVGGLVGRIIARPSPQVKPGQMGIPKPLRDLRPKHDPMVWWRAVASGGLVILGIAMTDAIRDGIVFAIGGRVRGLASGSLVFGQIDFLVAVIGGAFAGANTRAGVRQGIVAGLIAGIGALVLATQLGPKRARAIEFWADQCNAGTGDVQVLALMSLSVAVATFLGGIFGAQVMPPRGRRRRRQTAQGLGE